MISMEKKKIASSSGRWACPWGTQGMQVAGSRWVIRMGDAGKVSCLCHRPWGGHGLVYLRNCREAEAATGGGRAEKRER